MTMHEPRTIDAVILSEVARLLGEGRDYNLVIARMRSLGLQKLECIKLLRQHGGVSLHDAKDIVHLSPAWADRYEADEAFHDFVEATAKLELDEQAVA